MTVRGRPINAAGNINVAGASVCASTCLKCLARDIKVRSSGDMAPDSEPEPEPVLMAVVMAALVAVVIVAALVAVVIAV